MRRFTFLTIGLLLFALYGAQEVLDLRWEYLNTLQDDQMYRRWSGLGLSMIILFQWMLSIVRVVPKWEELSYLFKNIHNWFGAFTPLLFYIHSMQLGYAYLLLLSITFFGNFLLGLFNLDLLKSESQVVFKGWMILHVGFSFFVTFITVYHVWVVFYYE